MRFPQKGEVTKNPKRRVLFLNKKFAQFRLQTRVGFGKYRQREFGAYGSPVDLYANPTIGEHNENLHSQTG